MNLPNSCAWYEIGNILLPKCDRSERLGFFYMRIEIRCTGGPVASIILSISFDFIWSRHQYVYHIPIWHHGRILMRITALLRRFAHELKVVQCIFIIRQTVLISIHICIGCTNTFDLTWGTNALAKCVTWADVKHNSHIFDELFHGHRIASKHQVMRYLVNGFIRAISTSKKKDKIDRCETIRSIF